MPGISEHGWRTPVGICDSQPATAEGVRALLRDDPVLTWRWSAHSVEDAKLRQAMEPARVLLIDSALGGAPVLASIASRAAEHTVRVAVWHSPMTIVETEQYISAGASGILPRSAPLTEVRDCLRRLASGGHWISAESETHGPRVARTTRATLTVREQQVYELVRRGHRNREVAEVLGLQEGTVKIHLQHIFAKMGFRNRAALILGFAWRSFEVESRPVMSERAASETTSQAGVALAEYLAAAAGATKS